MAKGLNKCPMVVKRPTGRVGGTNADVKVVTSPTRYTGGKNPNLVKVKGK